MPSYGERRAYNDALAVLSASLTLTPSSVFWLRPFFFRCRKELLERVAPDRVSPVVPTGILADFSDFSCDPLTLYTNNDCTDTGE
jgi:hypothetical protein